MPDDKTVPPAVTLDARIDAILQTTGQRTIANMTREEITARINELRTQRAEKKQPTLSEAGIVLKRCAKTKARKRDHKHLCEACGNEYDCNIGEGCIWAKRVPACGSCMPDCKDEFAVTWQESEHAESENTTDAESE